MLKSTSSVYKYHVFFLVVFASQLINLLILLDSPPTSAYNLYSYLDYLFIYLTSQHFFNDFKG